MSARTVNYSGVASKCSGYRDMAERWCLLYDLMGGAKLMQKRGRKWLPAEPDEPDGLYTTRLNRTFLYNGFRRSIKAHIGQAFMRPINVHNLPEELSYIEENADGSGQSLTALAALLCEQLLITGKAHPLVDFPTTEDGVTATDFRNGTRPYINPIDPRDLIGWKVSNSNGVELIEEIRFLEVGSIEQDDWTETEEINVRLIRPDSFEVHELNADGDEYLKVSEGPVSLGRVPIIPIYATKVAPFVAEPILEDLAWLNLRHWQSSSDQNNILHVARVPILLAKAVGEDFTTATVGANRGITTNNPDAEVMWVEHSGKAINAGRDDLKDLEARMAHMGSDLLTSKSVARQTATVRVKDHAETLSTFQVVLRNLERGLEDCIRTAGEWINVDASDVQVQIGDDLTVPGGEANATSDLILLHEKGYLSDVEFFGEMKRRGVISPLVSATKTEGVQNEEDEPQVVENTDDAELSITP